jgi:glycosyltransferase involved in cell wall biosynthesis
VEAFMSERSLDLSIVLPAYNEARNIAAVVTRALAHVDRRGLACEICVVDDGSGDGTGAIASELSASDARVRVIRHGANRGYGAAIRSGFAAARGRHILVSDGDGQFLIERDLDTLWAHRARADLVLGYRNPRRDTWLRRLAGWLYNHVVVRCALGGRYRDVNCGFKLLARRVVEQLELESTGALISAELLTRAVRAGATFVEVAVLHEPRRYGRATGLLPRVVLRMLRELVALRTSILGRAPARLRAGCDAVESPSA